MLIIIDAMLDNKQYPKFFVKENFTKYVTSNKKSLNVFLKVCKIKYFDDYISSLGKLYSENPETFFYFYEHLKKIDEYDVTLSIGYMLGVMARIKPQNLWKIIDENRNPTTNEKISYTCALCSMGNDQKTPKRFVDLLVSYVNDNEKNLKRHAVNALTVWYSDVKRIQKFLISFAKQNDENKNLILHNVTMMSKINEEFSIKILNICSDAIDNNLIHSVAFDLERIAPKYPIEVLKILRKWCKKKGFRLDPYTERLASETGKGNIKKVEQFLLDWIEKEKNRITIVSLASYYRGSLQGKRS